MTKEEAIKNEQEVRDKIMNNFDTSYLLEAGAGAGKTTIIVERILNQIIESRTEPSSIVAITFTKAASTELAERIQLKALEYLKKEKDEETGKRLEAIDEIFTGTIHSFCDLILREMPFEADLTPGYEIMEDEEDFLNQVWFDFLRNKQREYKPLVDSLKAFNIDYRRLREEAILAMKNPDIKFVGFHRTHDDLMGISKDLEAIKDKYSGLKADAFKLNSNIGKLFKAILEGQDFHSCMFDILKEARKYDLDSEKTYEAIMKAGYKDLNTSQDYVDFFTDIFNIHHRLNNLAYNSLVDFINLAKDHKEQRFNGKLTFNDILYRASKLIKGSEEARLHFKNKYKHYYVDEFQDTDPMQAELLLHLTDSGEFNKDKHWEDCLPRPGSLFVVGDPKQSIYRFRRADITIYNQVKEIIGRNGQVAYLDINFRSSDDICSWVEDTFEYRQDGFGFQEDASNEQAGFKSILSLWDDRPVEDDFLHDKTHLQGIYSYNTSRDEGSINEEEYVAKLVDDIVNNYFTVDKKKRGPNELGKDQDEYININKSIEAKDIMILTKTNDETGIYLRALKNRGIPALLAGEKSLADTRELINLFLLLDAILDYRDKIKLIAALRGSFYLDLDTIELFLQDHPNLSAILFNKKDIEKTDHPHIKSAFQHMQDLSSHMTNMSPIAFLERMIGEKYGIYNIYKEYDDLERYDVESALNQVLEILKSKRCASIYEIRNELEKLIQMKVNYELPLNNEFANNAVRVMNIHKAKGLEGHIVFLVGKDKRNTWRRPDHFIEKIDKKTLGYLTCKRDWAISLPEEKAKEETEKRFSTAEDHRLLYVAATRAKSALIIAETELENGFLTPLNYKIDKEISTDFKGEGPLVQDLSPRKEEEEKYNKMIRANMPSYIKLNPSSLTYNNFLLEKNKIVYKRARIEGKIKNIEEKEYFRPRGGLYGEIFHKAMDLLLKKHENIENIGEDSINYVIDLSLEENIGKLEINKENIILLYPRKDSSLDEILITNFTQGSRRARDMVKERIKPFIYSDLIGFINNEEIIEIFKASERVFSELQFSLPVDEDIANRLLEFISKESLGNIFDKKGIINGVIDLVIERKDNKWVIIDYKTDVIGGDTGKKLKSLYGAQIQSYGIFLKEILKDYDIEIDKLIIYSTYRNQITIVKQ